MRMCAAPGAADRGDTAERQRARGVADADAIAAPALHPVLPGGAPPGERTSVEVDRDPLRLAGLKVGLVEALELARRLAQPGREAHVHLAHLRALTVAGVGDRVRDIGRVAVATHL